MNLFILQTNLPVPVPVCGLATNHNSLQNCCSCLSLLTVCMDIVSVLSIAYNSAQTVAVTTTNHYFCTAHFPSFSIFLICKHLCLLCLSWSVKCISLPFCLPCSFIISLDQVQTCNLGLYNSQFDPKMYSLICYEKCFFPFFSSKVEQIPSSAL